MKFQFRYEAVLQWRRQQRDQVGAMAGQALQAIARVEEQCQQLFRQRQELQRQTAENRSGAISVDALLSDGRYDMQLQAEIASLQQTKAQLEQELERRQAALAAAEAEVKKFEKLQEKQQAEFHALAMKREQDELDESSARRYSRIRQG